VKIGKQIFGDSLLKDLEASPNDFRTFNYDKFNPTSKPNFPELESPQKDEGDAEDLSGYEDMLNMP